VLGRGALREPRASRVRDGERLQRDGDVRVTSPKLLIPVTAKAAVLLALRASPANGTEISEAVRRRCGLTLGEGSVDAALRALEKDDLIVAEGVASAPSYALTSSGRVAVAVVEHTLRAIVETDPKKNPNWKRPYDWPYDEDYGSPAWLERGAKNAAARRALVDEHEHGFEVCPKCGAPQTGKTWRCGTCGHLAGAAALQSPSARSRGTRTV
jgi:DNA-binding PadR family transcriptional regulator